MNRRTVTARIVDAWTDYRYAQRRLVELRGPVVVNRRQPKA